DPHVQREESQHIAPQHSRPNLPAFSNSATVSVGHVVWDGKQEHMGGICAVGGPAGSFLGYEPPCFALLPLFRHCKHPGCYQPRRIYISAKPAMQNAPTPPPNHCLKPTWAHAKTNAIPTGDPDGAVYASPLIRFGLECSEYRIIAQDGGLYR
ncbi:hypothetical protein BDZ97DRAFT_1843917, partial [Flammula alnicola]